MCAKVENKAAKITRNLIQRSHNKAATPTPTTRYYHTYMITHLTIKLTKCEKESTRYQQKTKKSPLENCKDPKAVNTYC
jgi:hypothetical protein